MTELTFNMKQLVTKQFPETSVKLSLSCVLLLVSLIPVLAEVKNSESLNTAMQLLKDPNLHKQSDVRFSRIYSYVAGLREIELGDVIELTSDRSESGISERVRSELQEAVLQRLAKHDPPRALKLTEAMKESQYGLLLETIFETWGIVDRDSAVDAARRLDAQSRISAMGGFLNAHVQSDLSEALEIGHELGLTELSAALVFSDWYISECSLDPQDTWIDLAELTKRHRNSEVWEIYKVLEGLAIQWYQVEDTSAIDEIRELAGNDYSLQRSFRSILKHIALEDPRLALDYVLSLPDKHPTLQDDLMRMWAESDLQGALETTYTISDDALRKDLQQEVAAVWAEREPHYILRNLDVLPATVRYVAARVGVGEVAKNSLQEAGEYALQIEDFKLRTSAVSWLVPIWSTHEPSKLLDWLLDDPSYESIVAGLRNQLVSSLLDSDPRGAFQIARDQPQAEWDRGSMNELFVQINPNMQHTLPRPVGLEAHIMKRIAESDSQLALELLPEVREGETKFEATLHLGKALAYQGDVSEALNLAQQLPESDRDLYYSRLVIQWGQEDPISLLASIEEFPSAKHQSSAAAFLLRSDRKHNTLSEAQVKSLRQHLSEADQIRVDWY